MIITINQAEIETAIKAHMQNLIQIKEGSNVEIDLKAGRGENGFSATIDITAPGQENVVIKTPPVAAPITRTPRTPAEVRASLAEETQEEGTDAEQGEQTPETGDETQAEETAREEAEAAPAAPAPKKSLFGDLKHPKNG